MTTKIDDMNAKALLLFGFAIGMAVSGLILDITLKLGTVAMVADSARIIVIIAMICAAAFVLYAAKISHIIGLGYNGIFTKSTAEYAAAMKEYRATHGDDDETD